MGEVRGRGVGQPGSPGYSSLSQAMLRLTAT